MLFAGCSARTAGYGHPALQGTLWDLEIAKLVKALFAPLFVICEFNRAGVFEQAEREGKVRFYVFR
jgi:hypothetical protein